MKTASATSMREVIEDKMDRQAVLKRGLARVSFFSDKPGKEALPIILPLVAHAFRVSVEKMVERDNREMGATRARVVAYWVCDQLTDATPNEISEAFNRTHATLRSGIETVRNLMDSEDHFRLRCARLRDEIKVILEAKEAS